MKYGLLPTILLTITLIMAGCDPAPETVDELTVDDTVATTEARRTAVAELQPTEGNDVSGTVTFTEEDGGVRVVASITGLSPGPHGFHVHEFGDCSAPDASSAGGHFNPTNVEHAGPDDDPRHVGDLGNIVAEDNSTASYDRLDSVLSFDGAHSIIARSVIVHESEDDLTSQPTGDAGGRLACGVVELMDQPADMNMSTPLDTMQ